MAKDNYVTIRELAKLLGISRIAVYKKVKKGQIKAVRIGKIYAIPKRYVAHILGKALNGKDKSNIDTAIKKTMREYGETLKLLGNA